MDDGKGDKPWISRGDEWVEYEDSLIGNKEGLVKFKEYIEAAIVCQYPRHYRILYGLK